MRIFRDCFFDLVVPTMSLFLFVALITLALYEAILLARQAWPKLSFSLQSLFVGVVTCLAIAAFGLSLFAIYFALYEPYGPRFFIADVVFGSLFATVILGVIFGVVSGILLHAHLHAPSTGKLSVGGKILIGFAFMAFLLGVSGEQLIHTLGRRLSKLSFGGAEIAFTDVTQTRRSRPEGDPTLSTISIDRTAGVPTFSLDIFTQLPDMINRDIIFINAAWSAAPPPKPTKQEIQDREKAKEGLNRALAFADAILSADVGNCLTELYSQTGDVDLLKSTLTGLMPSLRNLTTPAAYHDVDRLATDGANAVVELWRVLFVDAFDRAYNYGLKAPQLQVAHEEPGPRRLASACASVAFFFCSDLDWREKTRLRKLKHLELSQISDTARFNDKILKSCHAKAIGKEPVPQQRINLQQQMRASFAGFLNHKDLHTRPYVAMLLAGILAQLGYAEAAPIQLANWVQAQKGVGKETTWLRIRAQLILINLTDYWIRREGPNASIVLREFYLARMEEMLKWTDQLFNMKGAMQRSRHGTTLADYVKARFPSLPPDSLRCKDERLEDPKELKRLFFTYLAMSAYSAHHRLLHPEYAGTHAPRVHRLLTDLWETDLACTPLSQTETIVFRAWLLRLIATQQLQDALAVKTVAPTIFAEKIDNGVNAANLGLRVVRRTAEQQLAKKLEPDRPLLQELAPTEEIAELEQLLRVKSQLLRAKENSD
jgi:hypothetical protein